MVLFTEPPRVCVVCNSPLDPYAKKYCKPCSYAVGLVKANEHNKKAYQLRNKAYHKLTKKEQLRRIKLVTKRLLNLKKDSWAEKKLAKRRIDRELGRPHE